MRITEDLFLVGSGDMGMALTHKLDCNVYLMNCGDGYALIDSGVGLEPEQIEQEIMRDGIRLEQIKYLLLTHFHTDHAGNAAYFREKCGLYIVAPAAEAKCIETADVVANGLVAGKKAGYYPEDCVFHACKVDKKVNKGAVFSLGNATFTVYGGNGHSIGGVCYYTKLGEKKALFVGDLLAYGGRISLQNIPGADVHAYSRSILALKEIGVDLLLTGHLNFSRSNGQQHIDLAVKQFQSLGIPMNII